MMVAIIGHNREGFATKSGIESSTNDPVALGPLVRLVAWMMVLL